MNWSENGEQHRGANGWFTWFRHGQHGRNKAKELAAKVNACKFREEVQEVIETFLTDKNTRFNNHSLASFIIDELQSLKVIWLDLRLYPKYKPFHEESVKESQSNHGVKP